MHIVRYQGREEFYERMDPHVLRLLRHENPNVRQAVLAHISFNSNNAEMWQLKFSDAVFQRVLEMTHCPVITERSSAVSALEELRSHDPAVVRQRMLELATDESSEVRWRIPRVLKNQLERKDVQDLLARLLRDESPNVRFFTIVTLGPEKHLQELRDLAAGPDKHVAEFAADYLRGLESKNK